MPKPFLPLTLAQFQEALNKFSFARKVNVVHMHHTWRPNHAQYRGLASIESMHKVHTEERKFSDIAQHITIAPDGTIWTGRNWNNPPASAVGHNGNSSFGPFMFEMIGDFDTGKDPFVDPQRAAAFGVIAAVQKRFGLAPDALRFHRQMADKTCPGSAIDHAEIVDAVRKLHEPAPASRDITEPGPFSASYRDDGLSSSDRTAIDAAMEVLAKSAGAGDPLSDTELPESAQLVELTATGSITSAAARGVEMTTANLVALRPHVIDLKEGMLVRGGNFFTLPEDVERIFGEDMERAFAHPEDFGMPPRKPDAPFRIMIWAHGGLISETNGLGIAQKHVAFWKKNGVYPVYFIWETGFFQTVGQLLRGILPGGSRDFFSDNISDPALERVARVAGGEKIWSGMKRSAELASSPQGGATKAAQEFKKFCDRHAGKIEIHAAGHSAGAIFHAHFLPVALHAGVPEITALHFLAPAIRVDTFRDKLLKLIGKRVKRLNLFTMVKEQELDDNCASIYRKSLLYLIRFGLEKDREAEILGLEESLRRDTDVKNLFGLGGAPAGSAEALFSPSIASDGPSATRSTSHGGFDDDAFTMNSVAMRVLGLSHKLDLQMPYPEGARDIVADPWTVPEVAELQRSFASTVLGTPAAGAGSASQASTADADAAEQPSPPRGAPAVIKAAGSGRRRALCIGIDRYPIKPLAGCVADAKLWARTLTALKFQCDTLLDADATYANIKEQLKVLLKSGRPGDVLVWQYAGHGTQVPDVNGDEKTGDSPGQDEAICPVDLQLGHFLVDDEIGVVMNQLKPGVNFTMIIDCCHSGTINRFGFGEPPNPSTFRDERPRFLPLTDDLKEAYVKFAQSPAAGSRAFSQSRTRDAVKQTSEVLFSACLSTEVAWESNGQGEFTVRATKLLSEKGLAFTNDEFMKAVVRAFGANPRQTPNITCAKGLGALPFLAPLNSAPVRELDAVAPTAASNPFDSVANALDAVARELRAFQE